MISFLWLIFFFGAPLALAYRRTNLKSTTVLLGLTLVVYTFFGAGGLLWKFLLWVFFIGLASLNMKAFRSEFISSHVLLIFRKMLPPMSKNRAGRIGGGKHLVGR